MVKLYKSLYSFKAGYPSALSFTEGQIFLEVTGGGVKQDRNWYYVASEKGEAGYVPRNYVAETQLGSAHSNALINQVLTQLNSNPSLSPEDKAELAEKLESVREGGSSLQHKKRAAPAPPVQKYSSTAVQYSTAPAPPVQQTSVAVNSPPPLQPSADTEQVQRAGPGHTMAGDCHSSHSQALHLVDLVRRSTKLSHEASQSVVQSVLSSLLSTNQDLNVLVPSLQAEIQTELFESETDIQSSHDYNHMVNLLDLLTKMKEDDQQRNWMLYEDEAIITGQLSSVCSTLQGASQDVSVHVLARYKYFYVQSLVEYFQMETRWAIRKLLIETFTVMCSLDSTNIIPLMLVSVLPLELVQDMFDNSHHANRLKHCAVILTVLFSLGESVPVHYKEKQLGESFISFLLDKVENSQELDTEEDMADVFMGLLTSYNLQFEKTEENIVLQCLARSTSAKIFTEKLLLLLNREDDPVEILGRREGVNSVHKLVLDVFSSEQCISHFYTNDLMVLIDIIARQLADLGPGIERYSYLEMAQLVLDRSNYSEHLHRQSDLRTCLQRIQREETDSVDKKKANEICQSFSCFRIN